MPDSSWPPAQRRAARTARAVGYAAATGIGTVVAFWPPPAMLDALGSVLTRGMGAIGILAGLAALLAVAWHNWHLEWVAVWFSAAAFGGYTTTAWLLLGAHPSALLVIAAFGLTLGTSALAGRGLDLWVFSLQLGRAKALQRRYTEERP